ncbi:MAG: hypothetical protein FJZ38_24275 [Candidatus Rokubacteria bacterium]|nr:hypothetical protein [Candidatus Rokubacteria bacterium]
MDVERLRSLLGPIASAVRARCLVLNPEGRAIFATQSAETACPATLEDKRRALCGSRECPFRGEPYLVPVRDHEGRSVGDFFWCTGGRPTDRRALSDGLANLVALTVEGAPAAPTTRGSSEVATLRHELETARVMQDALLPASIPSIEGLELAASLRPASNVGGDYYDVVPLGGGYLGLVIADVSGHGVSSAMMMTSFRMALLTELSRTFSPAAAFRRINTLLHRDCDRARMFVTAVLAVYEPLTGLVQYANAGHNPRACARPAAARSCASPRRACPSGCSRTWSTRRRASRSTPGTRWCSTPTASWRTAARAGSRSARTGSIA